jgi:choline dehydrogenase-like flavoprotein
MDDLYAIPREAIPAEIRDRLPPQLRHRSLKGGVVAAVGPSAGEPIGVGGLVSFAQTLPWGEAHVPALRSGFGRIVFLGMVADDVPQLQNRVTLDPAVKDLYGLPVARVEQSPHPRDLAVLAVVGPILASILEKAGAGLAAAATATPPFYPSQYNHRMGTMRMGTDPARSVVDRDGRYWAAENLYVMDGSVMVSAGGYNPTETIQAIAWKLAEGLG